MAGCAGAPLLRGHQCTKRYPRAPTQQLAAIYSERHTQNKEISMSRAVLIDRLIGEQRPSLASLDDVRKLEATPFHERVDAPSTLEAISIPTSVLHPLTIGINNSPNIK